MRNITRKILATGLAAIIGTYSAMANAAPRSFKPKPKKARAEVTFLSTGRSKRPAPRPKRQPKRAPQKPLIGCAEYATVTEPDGVYGVCLTPDEVRLRKEDGYRVEGPINKSRYLDKKLTDEYGDKVKTRNWGVCPKATLCYMVSKPTKDTSRIEAERDQAISDRAAAEARAEEAERRLAELPAPVTPTTKIVYKDRVKIKEKVVIQSPEMHQPFVGGEILTNGDGNMLYGATAGYEIALKFLTAGGRVSYFSLGGASSLDDVAKGTDERLLESGMKKIHTELTTTYSQGTDIIVPELTFGGRVQLGDRVYLTGQAGLGMAFSKQGSGLSRDYEKIEHPNGEVKEIEGNFPVSTGWTNQISQSARLGVDIDIFKGDGWSVVARPVVSYRHLELSNKRGSHFIGGGLNLTGRF